MGLGNYLSTIPKDQRFLLGADLNKHVSKVRDDADDCHGVTAIIGMESATKKGIILGFANVWPCDG